jgi:hypothetical protein
MGRALFWKKLRKFIFFIVFQDLFYPINFLENLIYSKKAICFSNIGSIDKFLLFFEVDISGKFKIVFKFLNSIKFCCHSRLIYPRNFRLSCKFYFIYEIFVVSSKLFYPITVEPLTYGRNFWSLQSRN